VAATTTTPEIVNGSIEVESDLSNAAVFFFTEYLGKTPLTINNVTHGTYRVLLQKNGYQEWSDRISVTSGVRTDVYASLEFEETDTTIISISPIVTSVKTTIAKTSTAKVLAPWPSGTPIPASSMGVLVIISAVSFGLIVFRK
jgi:PEGA domain